MDRGKLGVCLGSVAIQKVKIDVRAWGFQVREVSGKPDGPSIAEAQGDKEDAF